MNALVETVTRSKDRDFRSSLFRAEFQEVYASARFHHLIYFSLEILRKSIKIYFSTDEPHEDFKLENYEINEIKITSLNWRKN